MLEAAVDCTGAASIAARQAPLGLVDALVGERHRVRLLVDHVVLVAAQVRQRQQLAGQIAIQHALPLQGAIARARHTGGDVCTAVAIGRRGEGLRRHRRHFDLQIDADHVWGVAVVALCVVEVRWVTGRV